MKSKGKVIKMSEDFKLGYLAGMIEGEGSFHIRVDERGCCDASLTITNNEPHLIRWLKNNFGGNVCANKSTGTFAWTAYRIDILEVVKKVTPYLLFKRQQAESFIKICELLRPNHSGIPYNKKEIEVRQQLCLIHSYLIQSPHIVNRKGRNKERVLVSLSGGIDSTTLLYFLLFKNFKPECITFNYGQKHSKEIEYAKCICKKLELRHDVVNLDFLPKLIKSNLLKGGGEIPEDCYTKATQKLTVVPNRNMIMLSIACGIAESRDIKNITFGAHSNDAAVYPDCRPVFATLMNEATKSGTYKNIEMLSPFLTFTKADIIFLGSVLKVPFQETWSCYVGRKKHCGKCATCRERKEAFEKVGIKDPTEYEEN